MACLCYLLALLILATPAGSSTRPVINVTKHLSFPDFSLQNPRLHHDVKLLGSAKFSDKKSCIQIPDESQSLDLKHQAGRAIYSSPIRLFDPATQTPANFETTFSFQFNNVTQEEEVIGHGGSGLTFIVVPDEFTVGRPGAWLGMLNDACQDDYKAFAIEFDTRKNAEVGDPNDNHVGINLGSIVSSTVINITDSLNDGLVHRAWIKYDGSRKWMDIRLGSDGPDYPSNPIYSGFVDISSFLDEYMFVGFSASTGNATQIHNILSWNFTSTSQAFLRFPEGDTCESKIAWQVKNVSVEAGTKKSKSSSVIPHSLLIFLAVAAVVFVVLLSLMCMGRQKHKKSGGGISIVLTDAPRPPRHARRFTTSEIASATRNFSELEILGSDYRGTYYRGKLTNGCQVAVKRFSAEFLRAHGHQGFDRSLLKEIKAVCRVRHPNLVLIRGWCHDKHETMVIYDFYQNGSLEKWLFGAGVLPWTRRLKVVRDVGEALSFLHSKNLAHKNVKATSVFLDVSFRAVLGDFGLLLSAVGHSKYFEAAVSQTADVFEFGILILELVSGKRRKGRESNDREIDLVDFAWSMHERDEKMKVVDISMGSLVNMEQAIKVLEIGLLCTLNESRGRPSMDQVVEFLCLEKEIPKLPETRPVSFFPYNSATGLCTGYSCSAFK
ncbi:hypothetical protein ACFE04_009603 [Oxalis oulophora]